MSERLRGSNFSDQANVIEYKIENFRNIPEEELMGAVNALKKNCDELQTAFRELISSGHCPHIQKTALFLSEESEKKEFVPLEVFIAQRLAEILTKLSALQEVVLNLSNFSGFLSLVQYNIEQYLDRGCMTSFPGTSIGRQSNCTYYRNGGDDRDNLPYFCQTEVYTGIPGIRSREFHTVSGLGSNIGIAVSIYPGVIRDILSFDDSMFHKFLGNIRYYGGLNYRIIMSVNSNVMGIGLWGNPQGEGAIEASLKDKSNFYIFNFAQPVG